MSERRSIPDGGIPYTGSELSAVDLDDAIDQLAGVNGNVALTVGSSSASSTFTNTPISISTSDVIKNTGQFTVGTSQVTFDEAGLYYISVDLSTEVSSGNNRSTSRVYLESDTGGGFTQVSGSTAYMYNRQSTDGTSSCSINLNRDVAQGEVIRVRVVRNSGSDVINVIANTFRFNAIKLSAQGPVGPKGDPGPSGDVNWTGGWSSSVAYNINDAVSYLGSSYVAVANNNNDAPPSASWDVLAQKGDQGSGSNVAVSEGATLVTGSPFDTIRFNDEYFTVSNPSAGVAEISLLTNSGTVMPSTPTPGQLFYRTDHNWLYKYDNTRGKWLGVASEFEGGGVNGNQGNGYLKRFNGAVMSATLGTLIPYDVTIIGMSINAGNSTSGTLNLNRNGVSLTSISWTSSNFASDMTLNADFDAGGIMAFELSGVSSSLQTPQARVWYRRKTQ